jgi:hypothetical protein
MSQSVLAAPGLGAALPAGTTAGTTAASTAWARAARDHPGLAARPYIRGIAMGRQ